MNRNYTNDLDNAIVTNVYIVLTFLN